MRATPLLPPAPPAPPPLPPFPGELTRGEFPRDGGTGGCEASGVEGRGGGGGEGDGEGEGDLRQLSQVQGVLPLVHSLYSAIVSPEQALWTQWSPTSQRKA